MMSSNDVHALLPDDVIYQILLWLSVKPLVRFKSVRKSWHDLIESSDFIKEHLHYHHYDRPCLKNENQSLIFWLETNRPPITFPITSVHNFEAPTRYLQLDFPNLRQYFPANVGVAIFNGMVCLHIEKQNNSANHIICLWNPATKQYRLLPQSPFSGTPGFVDPPIVVGFGFDVKTNDYKVVKLIKTRNEKHVEVYCLSTDSWRSINKLFPLDYFFCIHPKMPFQNGTCFCWEGLHCNVQPMIFCFDFCFETFRSVSLPNANLDLQWMHTSIVCDKLACVFSMSKGTDNTHAEIWVLNDYGCLDESWAKLYSINDSKIDRSMWSTWLSTDGNYLFFGRMQICRYNVVTEEIKYFSCSEFQENLKDCRLPKLHFFLNAAMAEFKESLVSVGGENKASACVKQS